MLPPCAKKEGKLTDANGIDHADFGFALPIAKVILSYNNPTAWLDILGHQITRAPYSLEVEAAGELDSQPVRAIPLTTGSAPVIAPETLQTGSLFLVNNGRRFPLLFDCKACEMAVLEPVSQK